MSATVGVACATWIADPVDAAALAVAFAICAMFALRCVHPPSGAVALTAVLGGPSIHSLGFGFVLEPIALQSFALLAAAIVFHALTGHRYPHVAGQAHGKPASRPNVAANPGFTRADLEPVLARRGEMLDIDPADLESVVNEAQLQAYVRTLRRTDLRGHHVPPGRVRLRDDDGRNRRRPVEPSRREGAAGRRCGEARGRHRDARRPRATTRPPARSARCCSAPARWLAATTARRGSSAR